MMSDVYEEFPEDLQKALQMVVDHYAPEVSELEPGNSAGWTIRQMPIRTRKGIQFVTFVATIIT